MKALSWNLNHRSVDSSQWNYFREVNPDVALLQEANVLPNDIEKNYESVFMSALTRDEIPVSFMKTGVAVKGKVLERLDLFPSLVWAQKHKSMFDGSVVGCKVELHDGAVLNVVSVHSPAWHIDISDVEDNDLKGIRLEKSKKLWIADLLSYSLDNVSGDDEGWIVAGDFNLCEVLDKADDGPNAEFLETIAKRGWHECLRGSTGKLTPTFVRGGREFQLDYMYVNKVLVPKIQSCFAGDATRVFDGNMSDHLPVVGELA